MQLVGPAPRWRILWRGRRDWMTRRFGKPQKSGSFGQGKSRCSLHTRKSGTRWSTSALFQSGLPVWPQRRACGRRRRAASPLGAFPEFPCDHTGAVPVGILIGTAAGRDVAEYNLERKRSSSTSSAGLPKRRAADTYPCDAMAGPVLAVHVFEQIYSIHFERGPPCQKKRSRRKDRNPN